MLERHRHARARRCPAPSSQGFDPTQLERDARRAITEATIDVYSGVDDHLLRKLDANLTIDPSAIAPERTAIPVENIDVTFGLELGGVNEEQTIEAPSDAQPIDRAARRPRARLGALGGLDGAACPAAPAAGSGDADAFQQCVQQATSAEEINACAAELQG